MKPVALQQHIHYLMSKHGGLRPVSRLYGVDCAYLSRLATGEKANPSAHTLKRLGLKPSGIYLLLESGKEA